METNKIYSVYVHKVDTDNGPLYYTGVTANVKNRWRPSTYKDSSLWLYIEQYGWEYIEHVVVFETDDREKALKTEDMLICGYAALGRCINKHRSGLIAVPDTKAYDRKRNRDKYSNDQEYAERERQHKRDKYYNDPEWAERKRQYERKKRATPEGKIYYRVQSFNRDHPDLAVESPLEARDNYLKYHIVPDYIRHDDI